MFRKSLNEKRPRVPRRGIHWGLAAIGVVLLLVLSAASYEILMEKSLGNIVKTAGATAVNENTIPDPNTYVPQFSDVSAMKRDFTANLKNKLEHWPVSYSLQTFQVFGEKDKGTKPPAGFTQAVPGPSVYIAVTMHPPFLKIPFYSVVVAKSYESSTGTWIQ